MVVIHQVLTDNERQEDKGGVGYSAVIAVAKSELTIRSKYQVLGVAKKNNIISVLPCILILVST